MVPLVLGSAFTSSGALSTFSSAGASSAEAALGFSLAVEGAIFAGEALTDCFSGLALLLKKAVRGFYILVGVAFLESFLLEA